MCDWETGGVGRGPGLCRQVPVHMSVLRPIRLAACARVCSHSSRCQAQIFLALLARGQVEQTRTGARASAVTGFSSRASPLPTRCRRCRCVLFVVIRSVVGPSSCPVDSPAPAGRSNPSHRTEAKGTRSTQPTHVASHLLTSRRTLPAVRVWCVVCDGQVVFSAEACAAARRVSGALNDTEPTLATKQDNTQHATSRQSNQQAAGKEQATRGSS
jgi:uncharacterized Zn finger protein (UPF0148 family)